MKSGDKGKVKNVFEGVDMPEPVVLFIGSEPSQRLACAVLKSSILRHTSRQVDFHISWTEEDGWHPLMEELPRLRGTGFSRWRFCVPEIQTKGRAIYLDADQVVVGDIGELYDILQPGKQVACVTNPEGNFGGQVIERNTCQSSVMVMDCTPGVWPGVRELCQQVENETLPMQPGIKPRSVYHSFMQLQWLPRERVQSLPVEWNHFNIYQPGKSKLVHFSHVASQPWVHPEHVLSKFWYGELKKAISAGHATRKMVAEEIDRRHIHGGYSTIARE